MELLAELQSRSGLRVLVLTLWNRGFRLSSYWRGRVLVKRYGLGYVGRRSVDYVLEAVRQLELFNLLRRLASRARVLHVHAPFYGFGFPPRRRLLIFEGWQQALRGLSEAQRPKVVVHLHTVVCSEGLPRGVARTVLREASSADAVITLSRRDEVTLRRLMKGKLVVQVFNPVGRDFFRVPPLRRIRGTLLYVGGAKRAKGFEVFLKAIGELRRRGLGFRAIMIGPGIRTVPWRLMPRFYELADVVVVPSLREGLPLAVLEAMACGRAVVASNVGAVGEVISNFVDGILVDPGNPRQLAEALAILLTDEELLSRIAGSARLKANRLFSPEAVLERVLQVYWRLL